ncbi:MAG: PHP domain-containing protein [Chlamydiota bacterium]
MYKFRADLHAHTTCSDGTFSPVQLVEHAVKIGLQGLSITDHDSIDAYETAIPRAKELGLLLGTGVEFSSQFRNANVHILGYNYRLEDFELRAFCKRHQERREKRNLAILEKLKTHAMPIEKEELVGNTIGRPHIAQLMVQKKYVASIKEAFAFYLGDNKICYAPSEFFSIEETISVIQKAGGLAFLAHPHLLEQGRIVKEILQFPFNGIECYYSRCQLDKEKRWIDIAKKKGLLISGGSDFHGTIKPDIPLGCSWVDESIFHQIFG